MSESTPVTPKRKLPLMRIVLSVIPLVLILGVLSQYVFAKNVYRVTDGSRVMMHSTYATDPADVLEELGLELGANDVYTTQPGDGLSEITVQRQQTITVLHDDSIITLTTYGETVESLLSREFVMQTHDVVSEPLNAKTYDGMVITLSSAVLRSEVESIAIPFETVYCSDDSLPLGQEEVVVEGHDGILQRYCDVYYVNGAEVSRTVTAQAVSKPAANRVISVGTHVESTVPRPMPTEPAPTKPAATTSKPAATKPAAGTTNTKPDSTAMPTVTDTTITTASGEVFTYTKKLTCIATAYSCNGKPGITASGTPARVGAIAVDPKVIPLGTRMFVYTNDGQYIYGYAVAEDTGGAIKGNKLDLYFNTFDECWAFGVRECSVYILG